LRLCEKLTDIPKPGRLPQMSQTAAIVEETFLLAGYVKTRDRVKEEPRKRSTTCDVPATRLRPRRWVVVGVVGWW
jgi:hypothetical protein